MIHLCSTNCCKLYKTSYSINTTKLYDALCTILRLVSHFSHRKSQLDPPPGITAVPYDDIASKLNTGDIMLFSGVTNTGVVIKLFDGGQFSHVAIVGDINRLMTLLHA